MMTEQQAGLRRQDWAAILVIWALAAMVQLWHYRVLLGEGSFPDPDDALRLVQVRDWLAGQSWFDVTQYRVAPPGGVPMHWSRLVDVPVGGAILFLRLFTGTELAEKIALAVVPVLIHLLFLYGVYLLAVRISGQRQVAILACVLSALAVGIVVQFRPMRIDHHGWQITLTVLATALLFPSATARSAAAAGALMALSLIVSIECLPMAIGLGAMLALRYIRDPNQIGALRGYVLSLSAGSVMLLLLTGGLQWLTSPVCDAMSVVYAVPLAVASGGLLLFSRVPVHATPVRRLAALSVLSAVALAAGAIAGRGCFQGLFSPLIRDLWYENVKEGLPIWKQTLPNASLSALSSLLGIAGSLAAVLRDDQRRRWTWIEILLLQIAAFGVSIFVNRAMATAHTLALTGNAWLLLTAFDWAMRRQGFLPRLAAAIACLPLIPQISLLLGIVTVFRFVDDMPVIMDGIPDCFASDAVHKLDELPPGLLFAPLDVGPAVLVNNAVHKVVATGHHRNVRGILAVINGFTASPDEAQAIIRETGARYVAICRGLPELNSYVVRYPASLAARLYAGEHPAWLIPVQSEADGYRVYEMSGWRLLPAKGTEGDK